MRNTLLAILLIHSGQVLAADDDQWQFCASPSVFDRTIELPQFDIPDQINITANSAITSADNISRFDGNVVIEQQGFRLQADSVIYNRSTEQMHIPTPLHVDNKDLVLDSSGGKLDIENKRSEFSDVKYIIPGSHLQGSTPLIKLDGEKQSYLKDALFSSCEPGREAWTFSASELILDHEDESGVGKHVLVQVKHVPILYLPYISFPIGERRRSGLLAPELKLSHDVNGYEITLPYYWNIAPNQDAIITPHYMRKRGLQLQTQYRYLTRSSSGQFDIEYLNDDNLNNEDRYITHFNNRSTLAKDLSLTIDVRDASDSDYLIDFGDSLALSSVTHLERRADLKYKLGDWSMALSAQSFQTIDENIAETAYPYRRLPQFTVDGSQDIIKDSLKLDLEAEWVSFAHESDQKITGDRLDIFPRLVWPFEGSYWFVKPSVGYRHSAYDMTDATGNPADIENRNVPVYSLDTGLYFDRKHSENTTQTLEPRLFYLKVPAEDQDAYPLFDTTELDFSFAQLFRDNRFSGVDRVADANQLTAAVTTRFINDKTGDETFSASIGQIHYFDDREVTLQETVGDTLTEKKSDLAGELGTQFGDWSANLAVQWDQQRDETDKGNVFLHYKADNRHIFNIGYRFRRDQSATYNPLLNTEQSDISFRMPIGGGWSVLSRWNYDLTNEKSLETIGGLEYDSCCWTFRLISSGHVKLNDDNDEVFDRAILFSLILKGLGSAGPANKELENAILGFKPEY